MNDSPRLRFHAYCEAEGIPLVGVSGKDPRDPEFKLHFDSSATKKEIEAANQACHKEPELFGGWQPLPLPDFVQFERSLIQDSNLPLATKLILPAFIILLRQSGAPGKSHEIRNLWKQAKEEQKDSDWLSGNCGDGITVVHAIESHAKKFHVPLV